MPRTSTKKATTKAVETAQEAVTAVIEETETVTAETAATATATTQQAENNPPKTFTWEEVQKMLAAVANQNAQSAPTVVQMPEEQKVTLWWNAGELSDNNVVEIGTFKIVGKGGNAAAKFKLSKDEFYSTVSSNSLVRLFLDRRWLIILNGLDDDELNSMGCKYTEGEYMSGKVVQNLTTMSAEDFISVFNSLCDWHKQMAVAYYEQAYSRHDGNVTRSKANAINEASRDAEHPNGWFNRILDDMNSKNIY